MAIQQSSKLLISESPLQVLPSLAVAVGLNEAIFLQQLQYWLVTSKHEHDGRRWVYNSAGDWAKQFPFWSEATIRRVVNSLKEQKVILLRSDLNKAAFDRTLWYSINYEAIDEIVTSSDEIVTSSMQVDHTMLASCIDGSDQLDHTYTNRLPETTTKKDDEDNARKAHGSVFKAWAENIPGTMTPILGDKLHDLIDECGPPAVIHGITASVEAGARNFSYIAACARNQAAGKEPPVKQPSRAPASPPTSNAANNRQAVANVFAKLRAQQEVNTHG